MGPPVAPVGPMTRATFSRIAAYPRLLHAPAAIGDIGIRLWRNDFQHRQFGISDRFHRRCKARERDIAAAEGIVPVYTPRGIGEMHEREPLADALQSLRRGFADEVRVGHVVDHAN